MSENNFRSHFWPFELVRDILMNNVCVKFEERSGKSFKSYRADNEIVTWRRLLTKT